MLPRSGAPLVRNMTPRLGAATLGRPRGAVHVTIALPCGAETVAPHAAVWAWTRFGRSPRGRGPGGKLERPAGPKRQLVIGPLGPVLPGVATVAQIDPEQARLPQEFQVTSYKLTIVHRVLAPL